MELRRRLLVTSLLVAVSVLGCGEESRDSGGISGSGGLGGNGDVGAAGAGGDPSTGGNGGSGETGGAGGAPYQVCTLGLCMEDPELGASCQEVYDACVGRGHYPRSCRMDADMTCGVFGETGPY